MPVDLSHKNWPGFYARDVATARGVNIRYLAGKAENIYEKNCPPDSIRTTTPPCLINMVFSACVLFVLDWRLALCAAAGLPLCFAGPRLLAPRALLAGDRLRAEQLALTNVIHENLGAQQVVRAFGLGRPLLAGFDAHGA